MIFNYRNNLELRVSFSKQILRTNPKEIIAFVKEKNINNGEIQNKRLTLDYKNYKIIVEGENDQLMKVFNVVLKQKHNV